MGLLFAVDQICTISQLELPNNNYILHLCVVFDAPLILTRCAIIYYLLDDIKYKLTIN